MLCCPKCLNDHLLIRRRIGLERLIMCFTVKRKYVCMSCNHAFRAPDRRLVPRAEGDSILKLPQSDALRGRVL
jgi:hypothetical protein